MKYYQEVNGGGLDVSSVDSLKEDPLKRMQYVVTGMVAGLHVPLARCADKAPIDPYLGETLHFRKQKTDTHFYIENIQHDPDIQRFQLIGPNNLFTVQGDAQIKVTMNTIQNRVTGKRVGTNVIKFNNNNDQIEY